MQEAAQATAQAVRNNGGTSEEQANAAAEFVTQWGGTAEEAVTAACVSVANHQNALTIECAEAEAQKALEDPHATLEDVEFQEFRRPPLTLN